MSLWNKIRSLLDLFNPTADPLYSWKETRKSNGYSRSKKEKTSTSPLLYLASFSQLFNKQAVKFIRHVSSEITPISRKPENSQPLLLLSHFSTRSAIVNSSESSQMHEETNCLEVERVNTSTFGQEQAIRSPLFVHGSLTMWNCSQKDDSFPGISTSAEFHLKRKGGELAGTCSYRHGGMCSRQQYHHNRAHLHSHKVIFWKVSWSV